MVEQYLPEHPFLRYGKPSNAVLGSLVLAHAVTNDLLTGVDLDLLEDLSRQPFLWRSVRRQLHRSLIDGRYVGFVLDSFWNDPLTRNTQIVIRSGADGSARVHVPMENGQDLVFDAILPLRMYGQVRDCDIDVRDTVVLGGYARPGSSSAFYVYGITSIICNSIEILADSVSLDGKVWLETDQVTSPPRLNISLKNGAQVGWAGQFASRYPWNRFRSTLTAPSSARSADPLINLVDECWLRLPEGGVIVLNQDFSVTDDERMRWATRQFPGALSRLVKLMVEHGLASTERMQASGDPKVRVRFRISWEALRDALRDPTTAPELQKFLSEIRQVIRS